MIKHDATIIKIHSLSEAKKEIKQIGSDPKSIDIMAPKAIHKIIRLSNIKVQDAIIIKQDMLSVGGEVALPKNAFELHQSPVAILIMGTLVQFFLLVQKLDRHYPRIQHIGNELKELLEKEK